MDKARGRTDLSELNKELEWLKEDSKFYQVDGKVLGSRDRFPTSEEKEVFKKTIETKIQSVLDTYYTLNIQENASPDFLASITSVRDMSSIPDNSFEEVIFENVDTFV